MKALRTIGMALLFGFLGLLFLFVILHKARGVQERKTLAQMREKFEALDRMEADGFSEIRILDARQFAETRTCWDFKVSFIGSGGQPMWGHYFKCDPYQFEGQSAVDYIVKDFCEEGVITCSPDWRDRTYDCAEESDCE